MPMPPALLFATHWVIDDDLLLLKDGSREVCDQPCVLGAEFGVGWSGRNPWLCRPFQLMEENNTRRVNKLTSFPWP